MGNKNKAELRFGVKKIGPVDTISCVWKIFTTRKGDVYLATRSFMKIIKFSFHQSGISKYAYTKEVWGDKAEDKAVASWKRGAMPSKEKGRALLLAMIAMPTNLLSDDSHKNKKQVNWLEAAPNGKVTIIEISLTHETKEVAIDCLSTLPERTLFYYQNITKDSALIITYFHCEWDKDYPNMEATGKGDIPEEIIFSDDDPNNTGRPLRAVLLHPFPPKDGTPAYIHDIGGYRGKE